MAKKRAITLFSSLLEETFEESDFENDESFQVGYAPVSSDKGEDADEEKEEGEEVKDEEI